MAAAGDARLLAEGCEALGAGLSEAQREALLRFVDAIYVWNRSAGLTTIPREDAVRLHLLDSLAALDSMLPGRCLDLGTGAGLPGLVLAVARPEIDFVLVESNRRRSSFLREIVRELGLRNVDVRNCSVEEFEEPARFSTVISRAFRPPAEFLALARPFVSDDGVIVLLLAQAADNQLEALGVNSDLQLRACRRLQLPGGREARVIASYSPA